MTTVVLPPPAPPLNREQRRTIRHRVETITPEIATQWLERNEANRHVDQGTVERYARDMIAGRWHLTGDSIKFGKSGRLLDGQHRLWAIIMADVAVEMLVVRGIENEAEVVDVIDTGKKRTLGNALQIHGERDANNLAAIIGFAWRFDTGNGKGKLTHEEGMRWLEDNPTVRDATLVARTAHRALRCSVGAIGAAYYLNSRIDPVAADEFWRLAATGENLSAGSPILAFRRWAITMGARRERPHAETWFAYALKAMALWRDGKSVRILHVKDGEYPAAWSK